VGGAAVDAVNSALRMRLGGSLYEPTIVYGDNIVAVLLSRFAPADSPP
jgi:hypothetical protein